MLIEVELVSSRVLEARYVVSVADTRGSLYAEVVPDPEAVDDGSNGGTSKLRSSRAVEDDRDPSTELTLLKVTNLSTV